VSRIAAAGVPIIVVETRRMRVSLSTMRSKTDRNDARGIAQLMRLGWYRAVHVKNIDMQKMRTLLTNRTLLKRKLIDVENHVRGALRAYGLLIGLVARGAYEARVRELLERCDPIFVMTIETMLAVRKAIFEGFERLHRVHLQAVRHDAVCRRLMTVPGVSPVATLWSKVGVDDRRLLRDHEQLERILARRRSDTSPVRPSTMKVGSANRAISQSERRCARRPRAFYCGSGSGRHAGVGSADRQAVERVMRDRCGRAQSLPESCTGCGFKETDFHVGFGAKITRRLRLKPAQ
jgi:hypothetical protein